MPDPDEFWHLYPLVPRELVTWIAGATLWVAGAVMWGLTFQAWRWATRMAERAERQLEYALYLLCWDVWLRVHLPQAPIRVEMRPIVSPDN